MRRDWIECCFEDLLDYEQPTKYIVKSTKYNNSFKTPVLTAGKTFILGYTNETDGIFDNLPTIIFDDFTTATQYVNFKFKVKSSAMKILVPTSKLINMPLVFYAMQVNQVRSDTHKRYWISVFAKKKLFLPPLVEQKAIVNKIEELFSSLDSGIADLKKAQDQLVIYRQAVLKRAFEGELTKEWRENQSDLPSAYELLEQIKSERQNYYKEQIEDWKAAVKLENLNAVNERKYIKPKGIKEFNGTEVAYNFEVPKTWSKVFLGNLSAGVEYGSGVKSLDDGDIPVIRMGNMQGGKIDWADLKFTINPKEIDKYSLKKGDVLFNRTNSPEHVGKTVLYKGEQPAIFAGYLIRVNHLDSLLLGEYLNYFLNSHNAKIYGNLVKTDGVNQSNINGQKLSNYPIPFCSIQEQHQIVREIESRLSVCDNVENSIKESLIKAQALRQSILKKAFEGKLLSEEEIAKCKAAPDYESASVLLGKIKREKII